MNVPEEVPDSGVTHGHRTRFLTLKFQIFWVALAALAGRSRSSTDRRSSGQREACGSAEEGKDGRARVGLVPAAEVERGRHKTVTAGRSGAQQHLHGEGQRSDREHPGDCQGHGCGREPCSNSHDPLLLSLVASRAKKAKAVSIEFAVPLAAGDVNARSREADQQDSGD
jgi:hypothetical protein